MVDHEIAVAMRGAEATTTPLGVATIKEDHDHPVRFVTRKATTPNGAGIVMNMTNPQRRMWLQP
jgi:hypothetical protein